uniref:Uncharacterized protein n=1 Tax=Avena sativa TaxID=4498 RepID=A0ACD5TAF3_AVESA
MCCSLLTNTAYTHHWGRTRWLARDKETCTPESGLGDGVHPPCRLQREMVLPVSDHAASKEPAVIYRTDHAIRLPALGGLEADHLVERAEFDDGVHRAVFLRAERASNELRKPPRVCLRVPTHLLVPEEEHLLGVRQVRTPVAKNVVPVWPERRHAVAEEISGGLDRERLHSFPDPELVREAPMRDQRVLGIAADVHDLAARRQDGPRQRHERSVRGEEPWVRQLVEVRDLVPRVEPVLEELDALVRAEGVERVVGGAHGVLPPVHRGVEEGLDPCRAGLGQCGDDDIRGARAEACVGDHCADHRSQAAVPALVMAVELGSGDGEAWEARPGGHHVGEPLVELFVGFGMAFLCSDGGRHFVASTQSRDQGCCSSTKSSP